MAQKSKNKQVFERLYGKELTPQEVFECEQNLFGFFNLLHKIDKRTSLNEDKNNECENKAY